ncbi:MAG: hypothetical protein BAJALOKI1v1_1380005 [Promethearchaeota archaeon]|nr:MAG: hypothetical protein BAJALOKI1v1_1380005 [Candidatus Lokiarchaeota archaeon]
MTYYDLSIISIHGFPKYNLELMAIPKGVKVYLRFFNYSDIIHLSEQEETKFELKAGLISALCNFSNQIDKHIEILEFTTQSDTKDKEIRTNKGDALITTTTESYLFHDQVRKKIDLIYSKFIYPKLPLDASEEISDNEETEIIEILTDGKAKTHLNLKKEPIEISAHKFLEEMDAYGLKAIIITSMDLSPLTCFSSKTVYSLRDINEILRNIGNIPDIDPFEWKYRQSFITNQQCWVFLINSGIGITVEDLFEPYYYLLVTTPNSYLGEFPARLTAEFNDILT